MYGRCLLTFQHLCYTELHHWDIHLLRTPLKRIKNNDNNKASYKVTLGGIMQKPVLGYIADQIR